MNPNNCRVLLSKNVMGALQRLVELRDQEMYHAVAHCLSNMCAAAPEDDELLLQHGAVAMVQNLIGNVHRTDTICFLLLR